MSKNKTPTSPKDPFSTLGLPASFDLEQSSIEAAYLQRVASIHPDLSGFDEAESARESSALNSAKKELLDPESRANAMLRALGGPTSAEQRTLPDGFLMDIMQTRQQIEADLLDHANREKWERWAHQQRVQMIDRVDELFNRAEINQSTLVEIRTQLNAWRYLERLTEQLDPDYDPANADFS